MATERWRMRCGGVVEVKRRGGRLLLGDVRRIMDCDMEPSWAGDGTSLRRGEFLGAHSLEVNHPFDLVELLPDDVTPLDAAKCEDIVRRLAAIRESEDDGGLLDDHLVDLSCEAYELVEGQSDE